MFATVTQNLIKSASIIWGNTRIDFLACKTCFQLVEEENIVGDMCYSCLFNFIFVRGNIKAIQSLFYKQRTNQSLAKKLMWKQ